MAGRICCGSRDRLGGRGPGAPDCGAGAGAGNEIAADARWPVGVGCELWTDWGVVVLCGARADRSHSAVMAHASESSGFGCGGPKRSSDTERTVARTLATNGFAWVLVVAAAEGNGIAGSR